MEINLKNKTAWVFGGSKGIGRSIAIHLAKCGANILLISRNSINLNKVKNELAVDVGQEHDILSIDMVKTKQVSTVFKKYYNLNAVDIIINNSGGPAGGLAHTADPEEYLLAFNQHLISAQFVTSLALPIMKKKGFGRVINIISTSVKQPIRGLGVSNTIRGAVANWSKTLSLELGKYGITVNNVLPGATKTNRLAELIKKTATKNNTTESLVIENMKKTIPVGRFADPEEIAYVVSFLCSDFANYINGINVPVDGGRTASL